MAAHSTYKKSSRSCTRFAFPASSTYLSPFQQRLHDVEIRLFTLRTTEGPVHDYYKRCTRSLMLKKVTRYSGGAQIFCWDYGCS
ncbi:hypothetical protein AMELA_G00155530 [Ameiurus melas]|uniref:Uncharacterized protein n=1 Tax=Ameiurus melas TaxID=219545 RepID=A0A7J6AEB7_AMEME|nr:hypothetical protein AMELA_G00155530 [Ameiurus melas]